MSKKSIAFTIPQAPPRNLEIDRPPAAGPGSETDAWVFAAEPHHLIPPTARLDECMLIDLSARRSWFELMQLIWAFPAMATWFWMAGIAQRR
jgi:hypothetical protein